MDIFSTFCASSELDESILSPDIPEDQSQCAQDPRPSLIYGIPVIARDLVVLIITSNMRIIPKHIYQQTITPPLVVSCGDNEWGAILPLVAAVHVGHPNLA
jgi:hypothetical protein